MFKILYPWVSCCVWCFERCAPHPLNDGVIDWSLILQQKALRHGALTAPSLVESFHPRTISVDSQIRWEISKSPWSLGLVTRGLAPTLNDDGTKVDDYSPSTSKEDSRVNTGLASWDLLKECQHPLVNLDKGQTRRYKSKYHLTQ